MPTNSDKTVVTRPEKDLSIEALISQAILNGTPVETMEKLLAMRRELKAEHAKEEFDKAMASFQGECPVVSKSKEAKNGSGSVMYRYAPLEDIVTQVKPIFEKNGFSYSVQTEMAGDKVKAICIAKHKSGHAESSSFEVPLGSGTSLMSAPQKTASALTFAKRYAFCNAFGIMTGDEDVDVAKPAEPEVDPKDVEVAIKEMGAVDSLENLRRMYGGLGKLKFVPEIISTKDRKKEELTKEVL